MRAPVETKVLAGTAGGGAGGAVGTFSLWLLGCMFWGVPWDAAHAGDAIAAVPLPVSGLLLLGLGAGGSFLAGWLAPHTLRPEEAANVIRAIGGLPPEHEEG